MSYLDKLFASLPAEQSKVARGPRYLPAKHHLNASGWTDPPSCHTLPVSSVWLPFRKLLSEAGENANFLSSGGIRWSVVLVTAAVCLNHDPLNSFLCGSARFVLSASPPRREGSRGVRSLWTPRGHVRSLRYYLVWFGLHSAATPSSPFFFSVSPFIIQWKQNTRVLLKSLWSDDVNIFIVVFVQSYIKRGKKCKLYINIYIYW